MQKDLLGPELNPAMVKAIAQVAEEYLGAGHAVTKAFGAVLTSSDRRLFDMAREMFGALPAGQQNMIWLAAKSRLASARSSKIPVNRPTVPAKLGDTPYTAADLSPDRVLH